MPVSSLSELLLREWHLFHQIYLSPNRCPLTIFCYFGLTEKSGGVKLPFTFCVFHPTGSLLNILLLLFSFLLRKINGCTLHYDWVQYLLLAFVYHMSLKVLWYGSSHNLTGWWCYQVITVHPIIKCVVFCPWRLPSFCSQVWTIIGVCNHAIYSCVDPVCCKGLFKWLKSSMRPFNFRSSCIGLQSSYEGRRVTTRKMYNMSCTLPLFDIFCHYYCLDTFCSNCLIFNLENVHKEQEFYVNFSWMGNFPLTTTVIVQLY